MFPVNVTPLVIAVSPLLLPRFHSNTLTSALHRQLRASLHVLFVRHREDPLQAPELNSLHGEERPALGSAPTRAIAESSENRSVKI